MLLLVHVLNLIVNHCFYRGADGERTAQPTPLPMSLCCPVANEEQRHFRMEAMKAAWCTMQVESVFSETSMVLISLYKRKVPILILEPGSFEDYLPLLAQEARWVHLPSDVRRIDLNNPPYPPYLNK